MNKKLIIANHLITLLYRELAISNNLLLNLIFGYDKIIVLISAVLEDQLIKDQSRCYIFLSLIRKIDLKYSFFHQIFWKNFLNDSSEKFITKKRVSNQNLYT